MRQGSRIGVAVRGGVHPLQELQGVEDAGEQVLGVSPQRAAGAGPGQDPVGGQVSDQDGQAPPGQRALVEVRERDAVDRLEVRFEGVAVVAEEAGEPCNSPGEVPSSVK